MKRILVLSHHVCIPHVPWDGKVQRSSVTVWEKSVQTALEFQVGEEDEGRQTPNCAINYLTDMSLRMTQEVSSSIYWLYCISISSKYFQLSLNLIGLS
ncbi:hypothetical protein Q8A73_012298 [Channa argus]|nr:hypothetical protein Q8A73_012298 [Channa argus]